MIEGVPYPAGIAPAAMGIPGPAFFPGGTGVLSGPDEAGRCLPKGGTMIVGHNFGTVADYERAIRRGREHRDSRTWQALLPFLAACGIDPLQCFFTNALLGLLIGGSSMGSHPGHQDKAFRRACADVLRALIALQRPSLILVCGMPAAAFMAEVDPAMAQWAGARRFADLDQVGPVQRAGEVSAAVITHPSYRRLNVHRRRFGALTGHAAELAIVSSTATRLPAVSPRTGVGFFS